MVRKLERYGLAIMRIVIGFLFMCHGLQKVFGLFGGAGGRGTTVPHFSRLWFAGVIEISGGALIALGLFVAPVAFVLCGEMATAYFTEHAPRGLWPIQNRGEPAVLYCFIFLYLFTTDGGVWRLDRLFRRRA